MQSVQRSRQSPSRAVHGGFVPVAIDDSRSPGDGVRHLECQRGYGTECVNPILGASNFVVSGGPAPDASFTITFRNGLGGQALPDLIGDGTGLTGGTNPGVLDQTTTVGGASIADPVFIRSIPNVLDAKVGNDARAAGDRRRQQDQQGAPSPRAASSSMRRTRCSGA